MHPFAPKHELRNGDTIRAYLDELAQFKAPIQLRTSIPGEGVFETTIERVGQDTFFTASSPPLQCDQRIGLTFQLDHRWLTAQVLVVSPGVFTIPEAVAHGEKRGVARALFGREDQVEVLAMERIEGTLMGGRLIRGRLVDLSPQGLRMTLEESTAVTGAATSVQPRDAFAALWITGLPHTPPIFCGGAVAHVTPAPEGTTVGFALTGLREGDQMALDRILARRLPAVYGQAFPSRKRKRDIADRAGVPISTQVKAKPAEIVAWLPPPSVADVKVLAAPTDSPMVRIRKAGRQILVISSNALTPALAEEIRQDGFKQVFEAKSSMEAQDFAKRLRIDLTILDIRVGGHWGEDILKFLHGRDLLLNTPLILLADHRNEQAITIALALGAIGLHERMAAYATLRPQLQQTLLGASAVAGA